MSDKEKIEELERKITGLSRSKVKAKVAYFKLKKEKEEDAQEKDELNARWLHSHHK